MSATKKVAVVTGSNKGIGFAIVRGLCKKFEGDVYLTSRDEGRGKAALEALTKEGLKPKFHQLDIDDTASIERLRDHIQQEYGGLDILVNNAGMAYKAASTAPVSEQAEVSCKTNFLGTLNCHNVFAPIMRSHSRVVHVSSMVFPMALNKMSQEKRKAFQNCSSIEELKTLMQQYVNDAKSCDDVTAKGWAPTCYGMSKVGVSVMVPFQQKQMDEDSSRSDILVNCCCPGYVDTDMTSHKGPLTIDQGAENPLYLALLPPNTTTPKGQFIQKFQVVDWKAL